MEIRLTAYSQCWVQMFEEESRQLTAIFGKHVIRYEHFGSTSIPGMMAKPVIDMMCLVHDIEPIDGFNEHLISLGYEAAGDWGIPGRRLFRKGGAHRTHHIHVYQYDNPQVERHMIFRDYLRNHPEEAARYSRFKEQLAERFTHTSEYSPAKKQFVSELEQLALAWHAASQLS